MRTKLIPLTVAAVAFSALSAFAATDTMTTGVVKAFDLKAMSLTLADGSTYVLPKGFKDPGLKVGEKITVGWQLVGGKHDADTVVIAK